MSSTKKRKTDNATSKPTAEQSQSSIPKHVYVVQSLSIENSGDDWEKKVEGIFTNPSKANNVALDIYNDHDSRLEEIPSSWIKKAKPELAEVEEQGPTRFNLPGGLYADEKGMMFCPRKGSDGGLRFGGLDDDDSICVV